MCLFLVLSVPCHKNYNIKDRELLEIKLALEEWRHLLEGSKHSFLVLRFQYTNGSTSLRGVAERAALVGQVAIVLIKDSGLPNTLTES